MGNLVDEGQGHFRIDYSTPFAGIDAEAPPYFINPSAVVDCTNVLVKDGRYFLSQWEQIPLAGSGSFPTSNTLLGFGELPFIGITGSGQYQDAGYFLITASASGGNTTVNAYQGGNLQGGFTFIGSATVPSNGLPGRLTYVIINQVVYLSAPNLTAILQLQLVPGSLTYAFALSTLTTYLGCSFLGELSGRLLAFNTWKYSVGPPSAVNNFPYQVAWSADSQQYGIWNPLDVSGNPTGAGFNNIPDVEDVITGFQMEGPTCYVYRQQGISEITPLNSGIQPFDFNHLWASKKGIGSIYPNSMSQYGSEGAFLSDTDVFSMGLGGLQPIGGLAKNAIFKMLYSNNVNVFGLVCPITINYAPELCYVLMMQALAVDANGFYDTTFWIYSYENKTWSKLVLLFGTLQAPADCRALYNYTTDLGVNSAAAPYLKPVYAFQRAGSAPTFWTIHNIPQTPVSATIFFPVEMIAPFREVTIDGIAFATSPSDAGSNVSTLINGQSFSMITTGTTPNDPPGFYKSYPPSNAPSITVRNPQLQIGILGTAHISYIGIYGTQVPQRPF